MQMVEAEIELHLMIKGWSIDELKELCTNHAIRW